jgi:hypothetical protein
MSTYARDREIDRAWAAHDPTRRNPSIGAEAWGRVRTFKRGIAAPAEAIAAALGSEAVRRAGDDFVFKKNKGRARALDRLSRLLRPAMLQVATDRPVASWAWLAPEGSMFFTTETDPGLHQDCVLARYAIIGRSGSNSVQAQAFTVEVPDHALGRLLQRCRGADPAEAMWQAHVALLGASTAEVADCMKQQRSIYLPAASGCFACKAMLIRTAEVTMPLLYARARTWLSTDQLHADQRPIALATNGDEMALTMLARLEAS